MTSSAQSRASDSVRAAPDGREVSLFLDGDEVRYVHDDDLRAFLAPLFPEVRTSRAGLVEPTADGRWSVDVGPLTGSTQYVVAVEARRDDALAFERRWVEGWLKGET